VKAGLASADVGIIETWQVVMDQRGAVQEFDCRGGGVRSLRRLVASRKSHGEAQARADARASGEDGVFERLAHERRITARGGVGDGLLEVAFDAALQIHLALPPAPS
jgi:hypothetical protein